MSDQDSKRRLSGSVTLRDVARQAGVSVTTVSNVANRRFGMMSASTRRKVEEAIGALGYRPDVAGRSLRLSQRFSIGLIVVDPSPTFIADAFTTHVVAGLSNHLNRRAFALLMQGVSSDCLDDLSMLRSKQTDALCIMASGTPKERMDTYRRLAGRDQPVVIFQEEAPEFLIDAMSVRQDDRGGAALLARRLLALGCRTFAFMTGAHPWPALENRETGFRSAIEGVDGATLATIRSRESGYDAVQAAIAAHVEEHGIPDAILAGNDQIGIAVINWLRQSGIGVPNQVRVTGFNAFEFWRYAVPALTTVCSPAYRMGELGAERLLDRLKSGRFAERDIILPVALQPGKSA